MMIIVLIIVHVLGESWKRIRRKPGKDSILDSQNRYDVYPK